MQSEVTRLASCRVTLSRHPVAVDVARAAGAMQQCRAQVVVFEEGRAFVVGGTGDDVLQPRHLVEVEIRLIAEAAHACRDDHTMSFAITDSDGITVGALTLFEPGIVSSPEALHALARIVGGVLVQANIDEHRPMAANILDGLRDAVCLLDENMTIRWVNRAIGSLLGLTPAEVVGTPATDLIHPEDLATAINALTRLSSGLESYRTHVRLRSNVGWTLVAVTGVDHSSDPAIGGVILSLRYGDLDQELGVTVERAHRMSRAIVDGLQDGIIATDQFGAVTMVNPVARNLFGLDPDTPPSQFGLDQLTVLDEDGRPLVGTLDELLTEGQEHRDFCVVSSSTMRYLTISKRSVVQSSGELLGAVYVVHDTTDARRAADELRTQALHDQLTGLANRRQLNEQLARLAMGRSDGPVAVCFIDLDGFKLVNDGHGHRIGDQVIRIAAQRLAASLRENDLLVRHGGDEFVALLTGIDQETALETAERLRVTLERPYSIGSGRFDLSASVGVAMTTANALVDDSILRDADIALYAAKSRGRNRVELFDHELAATVRLEEQQRRMLRDAIDNDRLVMHFQPIVDTETGVATSYEALARLRDADGQLGSPAGFVPALVNSNLMWELDQAAFALSCRGAAVISQVAGDTPPTVACNFSAVSLTQPDLVTFIRDTVEAAGVQPSQICIEITESSAFDVGPAGLQALASLRADGFGMALDDFGTGYSSLAHLRDLPLTSVKVDRSFIMRLTSDSSERAIADAIVRLAGQLELRVVAEGVETIEQLDQARELGFRSVQGWYYSRALPLTDVVEQLVARKA